MVEKVMPWRFETFMDERGKLSVVEGNRDVPFQIRRVFWVYDVPEGAARGGHSHKACQQLLICMTGGCRVIAGGDEYGLDEPDKSLYVPPGVHLELHDWQSGTVLLVLCSHHYEEEDYAYQVSGFETVAPVTV